MAGRSGKFMNPAEVVRKQDGRIDLFNTILARTDPETQIPTLALSASGSLSRHSKAVVSLESSVSTRISVLSDSSPRSRSVKHAKAPAGKEEVFSPNTKILAPARRPIRGGVLKLFGRYAADPTLVPPEHAYWHDDKHVIIKDGFPKAKVHMLVIPRVKVHQLTDLAGDCGLNILLGLQERANWLLERLKTETTDMPFLEYKMGFHIKPSLHQLHLHVVSQDFCADALKHKKHWNSFTTSFFVELSTAIENIKRNKTLALTSEELKLFENDIKKVLQCNQCEWRPNSFPLLKRHLDEHFKEKAESWRKSRARV